MTGLCQCDLPCSRPAVTGAPLRPQERLLGGAGHDVSVLPRLRDTAGGLNRAAILAEVSTEYRARGVSSCQYLVTLPCRVLKQAAKFGRVMTSVVAGP